MREYCWCVEQDEYREWNDCPIHPDTECYVLVCTECQAEYPDCKD